MPALLSRVGDEVAAFLLAAGCAGCDVPATLLCEACRAELRPRPSTWTTPGGLRVTSALPFEGVPARVVRALKQDAVTYLARPLGVALRAALIATEADAAILPIPTGRASFRRRGYRVPELLVRRAGFVPQRLLVPGRAVADQRGLGLVERQRNVRGSIRVRRAALPFRAVLVDDVITSGATLDEAARVCAASGIRVVGAVALAATPRFWEPGKR